MQDLTPQTITTPGGEELVVLPRDQYEALVSAALDEDEADAALYRERKADLAAGRDQVLPPEVSAAVARGDRLLKAIRRWRGLTQADLANLSGLTQSYLSEIESGAKAGSEEALAKIAQALEVPTGWISQAHGVREG